MTQERSMYSVAPSGRETYWWSIVVSLVTAPEAVKALRNLILIGKVLGSGQHPPGGFSRGGRRNEGIAQATAQALGAKPPSLFALVGG
jgi:hypothetical protein